MSAGNEVIRLIGENSEKGKTVESCGAQARPGFELVGLGDGGQERGGKGAETIDVGRMDGLVEADIFDGCSDDGAPGGGASCTRDDIDVGGADDEV